jgi:CRISPR/Cas system-associated protein Cas7 (RAMP superfamily)
MNNKANKKTVKPIFKVIGLYVDESRFTYPSNAYAKTVLFTSNDRREVKAEIVKMAGIWAALGYKNKFNVQWAF